MNRLIACGIILLGLALPATAAPIARQLQTADGLTIHYTLDMPAGPSSGLIVIAQGSGCLPAMRSASLALVRAAFPDYTALFVDKRGVTPDADIVDGFTDCPPQFHARHTLTERVDDYAAVLAVVRREAPGPLMLFGGSEGGLAMAMLAPRVDADSVILLSSATGMAFGEMVRSTVPSEGHAMIDAGFAAARANPQGTELFVGSSYRFWADILDQRPLDYMLETQSPFLIIQGGRDTSLPPGSARVTADRYAAEALCNLTYWEFPGLDHSMREPGGVTQMADVMKLAAQWAEHPLAACTPPS